MKPLVFLHGWGQSDRIWHAQRTYFSGRHPLGMPCLPGHGGAPEAPATDWTDRLATSLPATPAVLIGWSLGGLLAIRLALAYPARVAALVLVATTPCFCRRTDWPLGCADDVFHDFETGVQKDPARAARHFFNLMLHGDGLSCAQSRAVARAAMERDRPAGAAALHEGLTLLAGLDLRAQLAELALPCLVLHGTADAVVPVTAGAYLAEHIAGAAFVRLEGAGHAPFLTQAEIFNRKLEAWCRNIT